MTRQIIISFSLATFSFAFFPFYWFYEVGDRLYDANKLYFVAEGFPLPYYCSTSSIIGNSGDHMFNHFYLFLDFTFHWTFWLSLGLLFRKRLQSFYQRKRTFSLSITWALGILSGLLFILLINFYYFTKLGERSDWFNFDNVKITSVSLWR